MNASEAANCKKFESQGMKTYPAGWHLCQFPFSLVSKVLPLRVPQGCFLCRRDSEVEVPMSKDTLSIKPGSAPNTIVNETFTLKLTFKLCKECDSRVFGCRAFATLLGLIGALATCGLVAGILGFALGGTPLFSIGAVGGWFVVIIAAFLPATAVAWGIYHLWTSLHDPVLRSVRLEAWPDSRGFGVAFADKVVALAFLKPNLDLIALADQAVGTSEDLALMSAAKQFGSEDAPKQVQETQNWGPVPTADFPHTRSWTELARQQTEAWSQDAQVADQADALLERRYLDFACPECGHAGQREIDFANRVCPKCQANLESALKTEELAKEFNYEESAYLGAGGLALLGTGGFCLVGLFQVESWGTLLWLTAVVFFATMFAGALLGLLIRWIVKLYAGR